MDKKQLLGNELKKYVGNCDTAYFKYLTYSGNLNEKEALRVVESIYENINDETITEIDEIYPILTSRFNVKNKIIQAEKKVTYLKNMIDNNSMPYSDIKKKYSLNQREKDEVFDRLINEIRHDGLNEFEINQRLEKYFHIVSKQRKYKAQINKLSKYNYENDFTNEILEKTNNLILDDIVNIFKEIKIQIDNGFEFDENIDQIIKIESYKLSNIKKEQARDKLNQIILHKTDILDEIFKRNNIDNEKSEEIIHKINLDITVGLVKETDINEDFIELRCK